MKSEDFNAECTCFLGNPPCDYCVTHQACISCGELFEVTDIDDDSEMCFACWDAACEEGEIC